MFSRFVFALMAASLTVPASAQQPQQDPATRASMLTNGELMQAWVSARALLLQSQDQVAADQAKIKTLENELTTAKKTAASPSATPAKP